MHLLTKQDRSIYYWLSDLFSAYASVTIEDGYPDEDMVLPTISVTTQPVYPYPFEMGSRAGRNSRYWSIDVFAQNKDQRDEFGYLIMTQLQYAIPVYDYDEGFPPVVATQLGALHPEDMSMTPVRVFPGLQEKLYWRASVFFRTDYYSR